MSEEKFDIFDYDNFYDLELKDGGLQRLASREEINQHLLNPDNPIPEVVGEKTWMSNYVLTFWMPIMKPNAFVVYLQLTKLAYGKKEYAYPTLGYLAETTGLSESTVRRAIDTLQKLDFVKVIRVWDTKRNTNAPNLHLLSRTIPYLQDKHLEKLPKKLREKHDQFIQKVTYRNIFE